MHPVWQIRTLHSCTLYSIVYFKRVLLIAYLLQWTQCAKKNFEKKAYYWNNVVLFLLFILLHFFCIYYSTLQNIFHHKMLDSSIMALPVFQAFDLPGLPLLRSCHNSRANNSAILDCKSNPVKILRLPQFESCLYKRIFVEWLECISPEPWHFNNRFDFNLDSLLEPTILSTST